jgi:sialic acid synthase SpsE
MVNSSFTNLSASMNIGSYVINDTTVFLIAEVGANHEADILKAKEHIDAAREAGAHAVKFQSLNVSKLYKEASSHIATLHSMIDLEEQWHAELKSYAEAKGIIFCSSPTYIDAVNILSDLDVSFIKIASAQLGTSSKSP